MPSDKRNLITAKTMCLIFSLFNVASAREVPFGIPQYFTFQTMIEITGVHGTISSFGMHGLQRHFSNSS